MPAWVQWVAGLLALYAFYCLSIFLLQRPVLFPRRLIDIQAVSGIPLPEHEKYFLDTTYGPVEAWFILPETSIKPAPVVIFGHGNAEVIDFWPAILEPFTRWGIGVLLVEYPGYGRSAGTPSQTRISEAFVAAWDAIVQRPDVDSEKILFFGRSLGAAAVCDLSLKRPSCALILMSAFTRVRDFTDRYALPGFFVRDPFDNLSAVKRYPNPVLVIHGENDEIVPCAHGRALARNARLGSLITYGCGHNDCPPDWPRFWKDIRPFVLEALKSRESISPADYRAQP